MVRVAIVTGEFLAGLDVSQGIHLDGIPKPPHEGIRAARMIDVLKSVAVLAAVNGHAVVQFHDHNPLDLLGSSPGFPLADQLSRQFANFSPPR